MCEHDKVTGIEQKTGACVQCLQQFLTERERLAVELADTRSKLADSEQRLVAAKAALDEFEGYRKAEREGSAAQGRGASLEDNPYDKDSDMSACWSYGWMFADISTSVAKMQSVMLFAANMLSVVREVAAGGASGDEVAAKLGTVIDKLAPYIYEDEAAATG